MCIRDSYKIDFNKHKFKTSMQAIFTFGIYTRKKAKETLYAVQEEERKVEAEIAKMEAECVKLKAIEDVYKRQRPRWSPDLRWSKERCLGFRNRCRWGSLSPR